MSFEDAVGVGKGTIMECRRNEVDDTFTVRVVMPSEEVYVYSNIPFHRIRGWSARPPDTSTALFVPDVELPPPPQQQQLRTTASDSFQNVMKSGGRLIEVKEFHTYSVYFRMPDGAYIHRWNISQDRLNAARHSIDIDPRFVKPKVPKHKTLESSSSPSPAGGSSKSMASLSFEDCLALGGVVVHTISHTFYSVHVQRPDGRVENFNRVSSEKFRPFLRELEKGDVRVDVAPKQFDARTVKRDRSRGVDLLAHPYARPKSIGGGTGTGPPRRAVSFPPLQQFLPPPPPPDALAFECSQDVPFSVGFESGQRGAMSMWV
ncbi:hypothetical protein HK104_005800 [Borealophlyctis nickersoniae]|nr:hypothetical protein HK104_005800 [Borealophlyctis nickersoniae]